MHLLGIAWMNDDLWLAAIVGRCGAVYLAMPDMDNRISAVAGPNGASDGGEVDFLGRRHPFSIVGGRTHRSPDQRHQPRGQRLAQRPKRPAPPTEEAVVTADVPGGD